MFSRFKEALNYLEIVQNFLDKGIHFKIYSWPGMTTVIQETKPDILKVSRIFKYFLNFTVLENCQELNI